MSAVYRRSPLTTDFGDYRVWVTPVPIPNTEVKPDCADGTWVDSPWESRSSPDFSEEGPHFGGGPLLVLAGAWALAEPLATLGVRASGFDMLSVRVLPVMFIVGLLLETPQIRLALLGRSPIQITPVESSVEPAPI